MTFHNRTGKRIELKNNGRTALRNINEFNHGIVLSRHPLVDDVSLLLIDGLHFIINHSLQRLNLRYVSTRKSIRGRVRLKLE